MSHMEETISGLKNKIHKLKDLKILNIKYQESVKRVSNICDTYLKEQNRSYLECRTDKTRK